MKNNKVYILLILVGTFTLLSFVFDQLVINSEDKIREQNFLIKKYQNNESRTFATIIDIQSLQSRNHFKENLYDYRSQFMQNVIKAILNEKSKNEIFSVGTHKYLNSIFFNRYNTITYELYTEAKLATNFYDTIPIRSVKADLESELNKSELEKLKKIDKEIIKYAVLAPIDLSMKLSKYLKTIDYSSINTNHTIEEFYSMREKFQTSLRMYKKYNLNLTNILNIQRKLSTFYSEKTSDFLSKKKNFEIKKNLYILFSVLSQIISLFFLLLLFKVLLDVAKKKSKKL